MALSPPVANSLTIAVTVPVPASTTAEYCLSAASCVIAQGSIRTPEAGVIVTVWVYASAPPRKLYHLMVTGVPVTRWSRMGVEKSVLRVGVEQRQRDVVRF